MIDKPKNYENVEVGGSWPKLPPGGYVLRIKGVKQEEKTYDDGNTVKKLAIGFDIIEGEYMGFFNDDFKRQTEDKKWKGIYRVPLDYDEEWKVKKLKGFLMAVEDSNPGFQYDWEKDEEQLNGKYFGGIFNRREWSYKGKTGFATQMKYPATVDAIRSGSFTIPDDDLLESNNTPSEDAPGNFTALNDEDIPF